MNKQQLNKNAAPIRFKHFSRKGYSLFSVLGKEVLVGVLAVSTLTYAKADGVSTQTCYALDSLSREEVKLDEVIVTGSRAPLTELQTAKVVTVVTRDDISRAAAESINDVLKLVPGVDVRQRGGFGVQTDISVRGGNFDQITILLNGINISSPHTGHLSADFPISPDDIERIEILEGGYENGLNGVINIITKQPQTYPQPLPLGRGVNTFEGNADVYAGSYGYVGGNGNIGYSSAWNKGSTFHSFSAGYLRTDGATPNSAMQNSKFFYNGELSIGDVDLKAQLGYSYKPYEANTFYGASSTDQWESNERLMGALKANYSWDKSNHDSSPWGRSGGVAGSLYFNRWFDHYQWHRGNPAGENLHMIDARGASLSMWFNNPLGKTSIGGEVRGEGIWSTKLGILQDESKWKSSGGHDAQSDIKYKYHDSRTIWKAFFEHHFLFEKWTISPAITYMSVADISRLLPAVNIAYRPAETWKLFASWNMAIRMPTFTDLYYSGANIEGNSNLKPEKTVDFQIGARKVGRGYTAEAQVFYSHKTDMIDWVTAPLPTSPEGEETDGIFHSVNFQMDNWGTELNLAILPQELFSEQNLIRKIGIRYAYINENSKYDVEVIQSKYALEYLRNKIVIDATGRIWKNLNISLSWRWQDRIGENNPSYALLDAHLSWDARKWSIYVDGTNILNKEYYDYISIRQPGIVIVGGIKIKL